MKKSHTHKVYKKNSLCIMNWAYLGIRLSVGGGSYENLKMKSEDNNLLWNLEEILHGKHKFLNYRRAEGLPKLLISIVPDIINGGGQSL